MIVSHRHRFIFIAVPRTATHALRVALAPVLGPDDWQQQRLRGEQWLPVAALARIGHGHVSCRDAAAHLPGDLWARYLRFAFVRDPFERFLSVCSFLNRGNARFSSHPREVLHELIGRPRFAQRVLVRPQHEQLAGPDGTPDVDFIGHYERLAEDFDALCVRLGLSCKPPARRNASPPVDAARVWDNRLVDWVREFYAGDFEAFGYAPDWPAAVVTDQAPRVRR